ncbi:MAG: beta-propeller fold lactonase family protein [Planctomycetota bacterium]|nr:beta-propeller fold lactonase family protein [Planctomycetota bacterium]
MNQRQAFGRNAIFAAALLLPAACGGISTSSSSSDAPSTMNIEEVSHGFGPLLPHQTFKVDGAGQPTVEVIPLRTLEQMATNVTATNPIFPTTQWPELAILPNGEAGNHYIFARFNSEIDVDSVLSASGGAVANSSLTGTITVQATDPVTQQTTAVRGRVFINGFTYAGTPSGSPPLLEYQQWVALDGAGNVTVLPVNGTETPGFGFPGTEGIAAFAEAEKIVSPNSILFVVDSDEDLETHETFPAGQQISMRITNGVRASSGKALLDAGLASSTVGADTIVPEVSQSPPPFSIPSITPGNGEQGVDPLQNIVVEFTEPVQPFTIAPLPSNNPPTLGSAIQVQFGPSATLVDVPFFVQPLTPFDLTRLQLLPAFNFPGAGPVGDSCGLFNRISVTVNSGQFTDLNSVSNLNTTGISTFYLTGNGAGLVNAPVAPDAIYVARFGAKVSLSVIDMNGNGASTGNPAFDAETPMIKGNSLYPLNPNVSQQGGALFPPLTPGACTFNGGSAGVFTLTLDSNLSNQLAASPLFESVGDFMLGQPLDTVFNNGPPPFGCQAGGGNLCATTGLKIPTPVVVGLNTLGPAQPGQFSTAPSGAGNLISWAPHPNPPPLTFPPLCVSPFIGGQEPTSVDSQALNSNLLVPGASPQGNPLAQIPPQGMLNKEQNAFFQGPSAPQTQVGSCLPFQIRQQVGNYLYVVDRVRREVVVLNSNRFNVIDRISVSDPTSLAMSPNLNYLAVSNRGSGTVSFIDIDPSQPTFHEVVKTTPVGKGPAGIAWEPSNEDILVTNELSNSLSVISATSLDVRKTISNQLSQPFEVAITPRQVNFGFNRNVYFAYIINRNGKMSIFESGPDGTGGWGFDDVVGQPSLTFPNPKTIQPDHIAVQSGVWICHEQALDLEGEIVGQVGTGAVSNMVFESTQTGQIPLGGGPLASLAGRDIQFRIANSFGVSTLTGTPQDIAFDNMRNFGGTPNPLISQFSAGTPVATNGKNLIRQQAGIVNTNEPSFMFLAVPSSSQGGGVIDVIDLNTNLRRDVDLYTAGIQSIPADGAALVMDYFRQ